MTKKNSRRFCLMKDKELQAVHDDDLQELLCSLGVYDAILEGNYRCIYCKKTITLENLGAIIPVNNEILFACNNSICIQKMSEEGN